MKKEDIVPWDWQRIIFGEAPAEFLVEVLIRTLVIYLSLIIIVRMMGKRMGGQLTVSELAVMVTLGAILAPAMQIPQLGVVMGIMILICALTFQRGLYLAESRSAKFEEVSQGKTEVIIKNGVIQLDQMAKSKVSRQQLFSALRSEKVYNLGDVGRVYLEACGMFSILKKQEPNAGLSIFPPSDASINGYSQALVSGHQACIECGNIVSQHGANPTCPVCASSDWISASITIKSQLVS